MDTYKHAYKCACKVSDWQEWSLFRDYIRALWDLHILCAKEIEKQRRWHQGIKKTNRHVIRDGERWSARYLFTGNQTRSEWNLNAGVRYKAERTKRASRERQDIEKGWVKKRGNIGRLFESHEWNVSLDTGLWPSQRDRQNTQLITRVFFSSVRCKGHARNLNSCWKPETVHWQLWLYTNTESEWTETLMMAPLIM